MVGGQTTLSPTLPHAHDQGFRSPYILACSQRPGENGLLQATHRASRSPRVLGKLLYGRGAEDIFHVYSTVHRQGRFFSGRESP